MDRPRTLFDKIWDNHLVDRQDDGTCLVYIDRHLVHEVTSPQAFEGLRIAGRPVRRPDATLAVADHNVPTTDRSLGIADAESRIQVDTLAANCREFGVRFFSMADVRQGIVHIIGPEQGFTLPGLTIVCGDSHTSTHGAFGALAFGIGTSEVEHVLATQTLLQKPAKNMRVTVEGALPVGITAKDVILAIIGRIGTAGGTGHVIEYAGEAIRALVDGRPDDRLQHVDRGRRPRRADRARRDDLRLPARPADGAEGRGLGARRRLVADAAVRSGRALRQGDRARRRRHPAARHLGDEPGGRGADHRRVPDPDSAGDEPKRRAMRRSLDYMGLAPGTPMGDIRVDRVFIGSCTNGRIEDLRAAAVVARGRKVAEGVGAMVVPGSGLVKKQAEAEGLDRIFREAGFEWREPGCSMCLAMNADQLEPGRTLRVDLQPQLRGPSGPRRADPSDEPGDGRRRRRHRPSHRRPRSRRLTPPPSRARAAERTSLMQPFTTLTGDRRTARR